MDNAPTHPDLRASDQRCVCVVCARGKGGGENVAPGFRHAESHIGDLKAYCPPLISC